MKKRFSSFTSDWGATAQLLQCIVRISKFESVPRVQWQQGVSLARRETQAVLREPARLHPLQDAYHVFESRDVSMTSEDSQGDVGHAGLSSLSSCALAGAATWLHEALRPPVEIQRYIPASMDPGAARFKDMQSLHDTQLRTHDVKVVGSSRQSLRTSFCGCLSSCSIPLWCLRTSATRLGLKPRRA